MTNEASILFPFGVYLLLNFPFLMFNILVAKRKGKSRIKYGLLSMIPYAPFYLTMYLVSVTDQEIKDKLDSLINEFSKQNNL